MRRWLVGEKGWQLMRSGYCEGVEQRSDWHISEKSRPKAHVHSSKVRLNFRHHCMKAFSMTSLSILFNLNLKYCINNKSQQTITSQRRKNHVVITWLHETLSLAATLLPHEYFPTWWKACNYCSVLHAKIACNNCTWNHGFSSFAFFTIFPAKKCKKFKVMSKVLSVLFFLEHGPENGIFIMTSQLRHH